MLETILEQIPKEHLVKNTWYLGRGRNSNAGYWNGELFLTIGFRPRLRQEPNGKVSVENLTPLVKYEEYYTNEQGCFQPFLAIPEGVITEAFGAEGWDAHYGKKLKVTFSVMPDINNS